MNGADFFDSVHFLFCFNLFKDFLCRSLIPACLILADKSCGLGIIIHFACLKVIHFVLFLQQCNHFCADSGTVFVMGIFLLLLSGIAFQIGQPVNHADEEINIHFGEGFVAVQNQVNEAGLLKGNKYLIAGDIFQITVIFYAGNN